MKYKTTTVIVYLFLLVMMMSYGLSFSQEEQGNENRTMATFDMVLNPVEDSVVYRKEGLERLEAAMSDQIYARDKWLEGYLKICNGLDNVTSSLVYKLKKHGGNEYTFSSIGKYIEIENSGYIAEFTGSNEIDANVITQRVNQIERIQAEFPEVPIYVYYIAQAEDTGWFDTFLGTEVSDVYERVRELLPENVKSVKLFYSDFEDYKRIHYKSDHHWNHVGARRGYEEIYRLISEDFQLSELREPIAEINISELYDIKYRGSYARRLGEMYSDWDEFLFYRYELPARTLAAINQEDRSEIPLVKLGRYDEYEEGDIDVSKDFFGDIYGVAEGENGEEYVDSTNAFVIRNEEPETNLNLLLCVDSYNRAVKDMLASHFNTTVYFDYRVFDKIPIDWIIQKYDIDVILISSAKHLWCTDTYMFTFEEEEK